MILSDFLTTIRGLTKFRDTEVYTDALLISYLRMGEERLSAELKIADMVQIDTATLTAARTRMPADFQSMDFLRILGGKSMVFMPRDEFYNDESGRTTREYTTSGNFLIVGGNVTDSAPLSVELHYFGDVEPLTPDTESWVARRFPRLLINATMEFASQAMISDGEAEDWGGKTGSLINTMNQNYKTSIAAGSRLAPKRRSF